MIDRLELVLNELETQLKTLTKANGYDYDLTMLEKIDFKQPSQIDSGDLPVGFLDSTGMESYDEKGNVPYIVTVEIPLWLIIDPFPKGSTEYEEKYARTEIAKLKRSIKRCLYSYTHQYKFKRQKFATRTLRLKTIEKDSGWAAPYFLIVMRYEITYVESPMEDTI